MADFDIRFPIRGLSDDVAYSEQEPGTTSDALNVRGLDPVTGRERGAQREGLSKFCADGQALTGKVNALMSVSYDLRNITYSTVSTADETDAIWSYTTPGGGPCYGLSVDSQENVYCLNGDTGIVKLNSDGVKVWEYGVKVADKGQKLRVIHADKQGGVFVASSSGGEQEEASVWRVIESVNLDEEVEPEELWSLKPGGYVKSLDYRFGSLYIAIDRPDMGISEVVTYNQAASSSPVEAQRFEVPYPVNDIVVDDKGYMVVSCPRNESRGFNLDGTVKTGINPMSPESTVSTIGWTPKDLDDWESRVWSWYDADDIDFTSETPPEVGDEITFVRSKDTNGRHLYSNSVDSHDGPTYGVGLAGRGTLRFNGVDQSLISGPAGTNTKSSASSQQTSFPAYEGGMFAAFILCRPNKESASTTPGGVNPLGTLFWQDVRGGNQFGAPDTPLSGGGVGALDRTFACRFNWLWNIFVSAGHYPGAIQLNTGVTGGADSYKETGSTVSMYDFPRGVYPVDGTGAFFPGAFHSIFDSPSRVWWGGQTDEDSTYYGINEFDGAESWEQDDEAVLLTIIHDGAVDAQTVNLCGGTRELAADGPPSGKTRSLFRINGVPVDRWQDRTFKSAPEAFTRWGSEYSGSNDFCFSGEILEVVVLDRIDREDDTSEPKVITHPEDPDYIKSLTLSSAGTGYNPAGGKLRAQIQQGNTPASEANSGGCHRPQVESGGGAGVPHSTFGNAGTPGTLNYKSWVEVGTYTADGSGALTSVTLLKDQSGWGWANVPEVVPEDDFKYGGGGTNAVIDVSIHEDYSGSSVLDDDTTDLEKMEGYLVHKWGCPNILPGDSDRWVHPYHNKVPQAAKSDGSYGADTNAFLGVGPFVIQYDSTGDPVWIGDGGNAGPMCGLSAGILSDGQVVSMGEKYIPPSTSPIPGVSQISSDGSSVSTVLGTGNPLTAGDIAVGEFDDVFIARTHESAQPTDETVTAYNLASFKLYGLDIDEGVGDDSRDGFAVGLSPFNPDYGDDITEPTYRSQYVYVGVSDVRKDGTDGQPNVYKFKTVSTAPNSNPPRGHSNYAVSGDGELKSFSAGGTLDDLTTGDESPDFAPTSIFIDWTSLFNKVYVTDGQTVKVIDPVKDEVEALEPEDGGKLPENPRLIAAWRGRLVLARLADDPHAYVMSEKDNPKGWNTEPIEDSSTAATAGSLSLAGKPQDVINTLIPYSDDILIMGCDSSIWTLTGDPLLGGQIDLVTDVTGMAFGRPWCKDPRGNIFFFGSRGGVYVMPPTGGAPEKITESSIDRRMSDVDLGTYRIELVWNERQEGLHVLQTPYGSGGSAVRHWFWDRKRNAWWEDEFGDTTVQPTAALVIDGDTVDDRVMLVGGEDGAIRQFDESATDDDGFGIEARVLFGPIVPKQGEGKEVRFSHLAVTLASEQDGAIVQTYISDTADDKGTAFSQDDMSPGRNPYLTRKVKGGYYWVQLLNANPHERWAFEGMSVRAYPAGRRRDR